VRDAAGFKYLDAIARLPNSFRTKVEGLMGSWDGDASNDVVFRDGRVWNQGHGLSYVDVITHPGIADVQDSWTVTPEETLFHLSAAQSHATCVVNRLRTVRSAALDMNQRNIALANEICADKLGLQGVWLRTCVMDYVLSGRDRSFAENHLLARKLFNR